MADIPLVAGGALPTNMGDGDSPEGGLEPTLVTGADCADSVGWFEQADRHATTIAALNRQVSSADPVMPARLRWLRVLVAGIVRPHS